MQNDESKCFNKKLNEGVLVISIDGEVGHLNDNHMKFLEMDKEHFQLRRKMSVILIVNLDGTQGQNVQNACAETDTIFSEINRQYVDYVRFGLNMISYQDNYILFLKHHPAINKVIRLNYHKTSRRIGVLTIFHPG